MRALSLMLTAAGVIMFATASLASWRGFMSAVHTIPQVPAHTRELWTHGFESYTDQMKDS